MIRERERLPNRREQETFELRHDNADYTASVGYYEDGRIGEIFLSAHKVGVGMDTAVKDAAILLSFALQHGCELATVKDAVTRDGAGKPEGVVGRLIDHLTGPRA